MQRTLSGMQDSPQRQCQTHFQQTSRYAAAILYRVVYRMYVHMSVNAAELNVGEQGFSEQLH